MGTTPLDVDGAIVAAGAGGPSRREVLVGAGLVAGVGVLAACGTGGSGVGNGGGPGGQSTGPIAAVSDVPVNGAVSAKVDGRPVLLTQAKAGTIVGLSAICTHQGCTVLPNRDRLLCPCHGSVYGLDGSNISGPAPAPLPPVPVHVVNGEVLAGAG